MAEINNKADIQNQPVPAQKHWTDHISKFGIWIAIAIGTIIVIGLYVSTRNPSTNTTAASTAQVSITSNGFMPQTISINKGSQLTWTNNDAKAHQVAADPYPKNNSIPGFDSTQLLQQGDSYSFSFQSPGTYHVHDEQSPYKTTETIVVR